VLSWVFARCAGHGAATQTPIGWMPPVGPEGIDTRGVDVTDEAMAELLRVDTEEWRAQLPQFREYLAKFENLPVELNAQLDALEQRAHLLAPPEFVIQHANRASNQAALHLYNASTERHLGVHALEQAERAFVANVCSLDCCTVLQNCQ